MIEACHKGGAIVIMGVYAMFLDKFPLGYAMTQSNLGNAYFGMAEEGDGEANLEKAVEAYSEALKVKTPERFPVDCAIINFNLGSLHQFRATTTKDDTTKQESLKRAELALETSLRIFAQERMEGWWQRVDELLQKVRAMES